MTIHREGFKILLTSFAVLLVLNLLLFTYCGFAWVNYLFRLFSIVIFFLFLQFFRLPKRKNLSAPNQLVSPCDGKVVAIEEVEEPEYFHDKRIQVSIFMSPLNVHANWVPCAGTVNYVKYHEGLYLVAWHPKSSTENERTTIVIEHETGNEILVRQIAGAVARRIRYYVKEGEIVERNKELGFIKFGSRVDLLLPLKTDVNVKIGDITKGNETVVATMK